MGGVWDIFGYANEKIKQNKRKHHINLLSRARINQAKFQMYDDK